MLSFEVDSDYCSFCSEGNSDVEWQESWIEKKKGLYSVGKSVLQTSYLL